MGNRKKRKSSNPNIPTKKRTLSEPIYTPFKAFLLLLLEDGLVIAMLGSAIYGFGIVGIGHLITQSTYEFRGHTVSLGESRIWGIFFLSFSIVLLVLTFREQVSNYRNIRSRLKPRLKSDIAKEDILGVLLILCIIFGLTWLCTTLGMERITS